VYSHVLYGGLVCPLVQSKWFDVLFILKVSRVLLKMSGFIWPYLNLRNSLGPPPSFRI
jgi:hypothetical protein